MTNITNAEKIKSAVVNLFTVKLQNDAQKAEEYAAKYLGDGAIDENEYQEISEEFGEDFSASIKNIAGEAPKDIEEVEAGNVNDYAKAIALANGVENALNQPNCKEDWDKVIELLENASPEEIQAANLYFQINFKDKYGGRDMIQEIAANYPDGGTDEAIKGQREAFKLAMQGKTDVLDQDLLNRAQKVIATFSDGQDTTATEDNSPRLTDQEAIEIAAELEAALAQSGGNEDWAKVNEILDGLSDKQLQQVNIAYKLTYGDQHEGRNLIEEICANEIDGGDVNEQDLKYQAIMKAMRGQTDLTDAESIAFEQQIRNNSVLEPTSNGGSNNNSSNTGELTMLDYANANPGNPNSAHTLPMENYLNWANSEDTARINAPDTPAKEIVSEIGPSNKSNGTSDDEDDGKHGMKYDQAKWALEQAKAMHEAMDGNEDWDTLDDITEMSNDEIEQVSHAYYVLYGKDLKSEIADQTAGMTKWGNSPFTDYDERQDAIVNAMTEARNADWKDAKKKKKDIEACHNGETW